MDIAYLLKSTENSDAVHQALKQHNHVCQNFDCVRDFVHSVRERNYDLYILSALVPDCEGLIVWLRNISGMTPPIIVLGPASCEQTLVRALTAGADGYAAFPLRPAEFSARIEALLRRVYQTNCRTKSLFESAPYSFDLRRRQARCRNVPLCASASEFDLALNFFQNVDRLIPRDQLEIKIWGRVVSPQSRALDTLVSRVRARFKIEQENGFKLICIHSHGYRLLRVGTQASQEEERHETNVHSVA